VPPSHVKPQWYYILLSLAAGHQHGLAIARAVQEFSDGRVRLWPAMLYGSLEDLATHGWIREIADGSARRPDASERKRYYSLTRAGRTVMDAETRRLADLVRLARAVARREPT